MEHVDDLCRTLDHGYPDVTEVDDGAWLPALGEALTAHRQAVERIAAHPAEPTVANTLQPLGRAHALMMAPLRAFQCVFSAEGTASRQQVQAELSPTLAEHRDQISLHPGLFRRLERLQERVEAQEEPATEEQQRMVEILLRDARLAGAGLSIGAQEHLQELNRRLAAEENAYQALQRREAAGAAVHITEAAELEGLGEEQRDSAARAAREAGYDHGWLLRLTMPVQQPMLASLRRREVRRRLHAASVGRGALDGDDGRTTRQIGANIARLRAQKAAALGYENFLESVLPARTAEDRATVETMLHRIADGALPRLEDEAQAVAEGLRRRGELGAEDRLEPWDLKYGIERLRGSTERSQPNGAEASDAGIPLSEALHQLFRAAHQVYGLSVVEREDLPPFVPGALSFEVFDGGAGDPSTGLGLFLLDPYTRDTKSGGAWMNSFCVAAELTSSRPVVINCLNLAPPAPGTEARLSSSEMKTLFHEFGHALHGLLAEAEFEELSGTAVPRDNVEFPSQVNEVFQELFVTKTTPVGAAPSAAEMWGRGLSTVEHVAAVVLDLAWHTLTPQEAETAAEDPEAFEQVSLDAWGLDHPLVPPRYGSGFFKHIFAGSGYAAGYYSYLWAEVLAADASEWFREAMQDPEALQARGRTFRAELLSRGNTRDPLGSYRTAVGRHPQMEPLLRRLGLN